MANGGISPSGKALRFVLWRAPKGAAEYAWTRNMALATEEGRRWLVLAGAGFWVWITWIVANWTGIQGFQEIAAFVVLLWFWRLFVNLRRVWKQRYNLKAQAVSQQRMREMYQMQQQALELARRGVGQVGGGLYTVAGMGKQRDEEYAAQQQRAREQADEVRGYLPPEQRDMPLGDRYEPQVQAPKWMRDRWAKWRENDGEGDGE